METRPEVLTSGLVCLKMHVLERVIEYISFLRDNNLIKLIILIVRYLLK